MAETRVEDVQELKPYLNLIKALGYRTTDQLVGAARASPDPLADYFDIGRPALQALIAKLPSASVAAGLHPAASSPANRRLGVQLARVPRMQRAAAVSAHAPMALPPRVDLIPQMQPIRDQADRGTCVAHAATAAAELFWRGKGQTIDLSRQFLYWACKQNDGIPNDEGTWIGVAMPQLRAVGCCLESDWSYNPARQAGNESQDPPPPSALSAAANHKINTFRQIAPTSVQDIKGELAQGRAVAFSIPVFNSWYMNADVTRTGEIINPIPGELDVGGHAMCFVGYEDAPSSPEIGGGRFFLRNSWNGHWAPQAVIGTQGYGTIPFSYIARYGSEAYSILA